ncbi:MAG: hypothetical protein M5U28_35965 [Sandaracinaceae bacterium]|nr:hypothetical protein [Sandaracinaceae bacterium]
MDGGRFVIAFGDEDESALRTNDEVHRRLSAARDQGEVEAFLSLHSLLWSAGAQRASLRALAGSPRLFERTTAALEREGFVTSAFEPFRAALAEQPAPLSWEELSRSPLGPLASNLRIETSDGRVGVVTLLRGADVQALERRLEVSPASSSSIRRASWRASTDSSARAPSRCCSWGWPACS